MAFSANDRRRIFESTYGDCHICGKQLAYGNYGLLGLRGAWEIEHKVPKAYGGSDEFRNLAPACISCNRSKGTRSTRSARADSGYAPSLGFSGQSALPRNLSIAQLNDRERVICQIVNEAGRITLAEIVRSVPDSLFPGSYDPEARYWTVKNALRRPVSEGFVHSSMSNPALRRGEYTPGPRALSTLVA